MGVELTAVKSRGEMIHADMSAEPVGLGANTWILYDSACKKHTWSLLRLVKNNQMNRFFGKLLWFDKHFCLMAALYSLSSLP